MRQARVADAVAPGVAVGLVRGGFGKQAAFVLVVVGFLVEVERIIFQQASHLDKGREISRR